MSGTNFLNGMFGKIDSGMCRLSMSGGIAVKTSTGYKSYNIKTGKLTNCSNFVVDMGADMFFMIPTNKVEPGDIIIVGGKPRCVIKGDKNEITVINYENSSKETIIPERHVFMGNTYFYGKIVSIFGTNLGGKNALKKIMQFKMMSEMLGGSASGSGAGIGGMFNGNSMLPMMMMFGGGEKGGFFEDMFGGMFESDIDDDKNPIASAIGAMTDAISDATSDEAADEE